MAQITKRHMLFGKSSSVVILGCFSVALLMGCQSSFTLADDGGLIASNTDSKVDTHTDDDSSGDTNQDADTDKNTSEDVDTNTDTESYEDSDNVCDEETFKIESSPPNLMILLDRSGTMAKDVEGTVMNRWEVCSEAIMQLTSKFNDQIRFGLATFSSCLPYGCSPGSIQVPIASNNAGAIEDFLTARVGQGSIDGNQLNEDGQIEYLCDSRVPETSTGASLEALTNEVSLMNAKSDNAILLLTDGSESSECIVDNVDGPTGAAFLLGQQPSVRTFAVGFEGANIDELEEIARAGGTSQAYYADAPTSLNEALKAITNSVSVSCTYTLPGLKPDADKGKVNFYFDGVNIGYDNNCNTGKGWAWTDTSRTAVEFCEQSCKKLNSGEVTRVTATFGCKTHVVV